ncbi:hypothetical protein BK660_17705 [Pseudomonas brassicacearum]|uniref:Cupin 2 conserved barrel domain-containing protein n=1 Tax=Pseudomonas brassicacearum TaxID=930166 RepID=A0A423I637_9PSED|nr:hypothetical protein BK660_17705 [Pseudomonas brassicacearum]
MVATEDMSVKTSEMLLLVPNGYPVWIDVPQATTGGAGTAMRFVLPVNAHNLPLMHRHETKLVVALSGALEIRSGRQRIALLKEGDAVKLHAGTAHRIHQQGACPSTVGIVLWPGVVESAFRELADAAKHNTILRSEMVEILSRYGVVWTTGAAREEPQTPIVRPLQEWFAELPETVAKLLALKWAALGDNLAQ